MLFLLLDNWCGFSSNERLAERLLTSRTIRMSSKGDCPVDDLQVNDRSGNDPVITYDENLMSLIRRFKKSLSHLEQPFMLG